MHLKFKVNLLICTDGLGGAGGESVSVLTGNTACDPELVTCFSCVLSSAFPSINDLSTNMQSKYEYGKIPPLSSSGRSFFSGDRLCKGGSIPEKETVPHRQLFERKGNDGK